MKRVKMSCNQVIVLALFISALVLRFYPIPQDLFFGPEEGRDALAAYRIYHEKTLTLIGAKTDVDGLFHGPIFYYFLAIAYPLARGNPVGASLLTITVNSLAVVALFFLGRKLFSARVGFMAACLYAVSLRAIEYGRWFSAPALAPPLMVLVVYFLYKITVEKKYNYLLLVAIGAGLLVQLELLNSYLLLPLILAVLLWSRARITWRYLGISALIFAVMLSNFLFFDLRHQFLMTKTFWAVTKGEKGFHAPLSISIPESLGRFGGEITLTVAPNIWWLAWSLFFIGFFIVCKSLTTKFGSYHLLFLALVVPVVSLAFSRHSVLSHFFLSLGPFVILFVALSLDWLWRKSAVASCALLLILILMNLLALRELRPWGITIGQEKAIIDFVYADARNKPFRYEAFTFPYFWKDAWKYMFQWYGKNRYGYIPLDEGTKNVYFLWEEEDTQFQRRWYQEHVTPYGEIVAQTKVGHVFAERREKKIE